MGEDHLRNEEEEEENKSRRRHPDELELKCVEDIEDQAPRRRTSVAQRVSRIWTELETSSWSMEVPAEEPPRPRPEPKKKQLVHEVVAGLCYLVLNLSSMLSVALLLEGPWENDSFPRLMRHVLYGYVITQIVSSETSGFPCCVTTTGKEALPLLLAVRDFVDKEVARDKKKVTTFIACSSCCSLIAAFMFFVVASRDQFTRLLDKFPAQVRSGVFAAIGFGILQLGFGAYGLPILDAQTWTDPANLLKFVPAYVLGICLVVVVKGGKQMVLFVVACFVVTHAVLIVTGLSLQVASNRGFLLGSVNDAHEHELWLLSLDDVDWSVVQKVLPDLCLAAFVGPLLNVGINIRVLEQVFASGGLRVSYRREFLCQGFAALLTGVFGGYHAYFAVSQTSILVKLKGGKAALRFSCALLIAFKLAPHVLSSLCAVTPIVLAASLFVMVGITFLRAALVEGVLAFSPVEYGNMVCTAVLCVTVSVPVGVAVGLTLTALHLLQLQSQVEPLRVSTLADERTLESYTPAEETYIEANASRVVIVDVKAPMLTVFNNPVQIFDGLVADINDVLHDSNHRSLVALVLDFTLVGRVDATSLDALATACARLAENPRLAVVNLPNGAGERDVLERYLGEKGCKLNALHFYDRDCDDTEDAAMTAIDEGTGPTRRASGFHPALIFAAQRAQTERLAAFKSKRNEAPTTSQAAAAVTMPSSPPMSPQASTTVRHKTSFGPSWTTRTSTQVLLRALLEVSPRQRALVDAEEMLLRNTTRRVGWDSVLFQLFVPKAQWPLPTRLSTAFRTVRQAVDFYAPLTNADGRHALYSFIFHSCKTHIVQLKPGRALVRPNEDSNVFHVLAGGQLSVFQGENGYLLERLKMPGQLATVHCWASAASPVAHDDGTLLYAADHAPDITVVAASRCLVLAVDLGDTAVSSAIPPVLVRMILTKSRITMRRLQFARHNVVRGGIQAATRGDSTSDNDAERGLPRHTSTRTRRGSREPVTLDGLSWGQIKDLAKIGRRWRPSFERSTRRPDSPLT